METAQNQDYRSTSQRSNVSDTNSINIRIFGPTMFYDFCPKIYNGREKARIVWKNMHPCLLAAISGVSGSWLICMKSTASSPAL